MYELWLHAPRNVVDEPMGLWSRITAGARKVDDVAVGQLGFFGSIVVAFVGGEYFVFDQENFEGVRKEALGSAEASEFIRFRLAGPSNAEQSARLVRLEQEICSEIFRRAHHEHLEWQLEGTAKVLGRYQFSPGDLRTGWRVVGSILANAWKFPPGSDLVRTEEPFMGVVVPAPKPVGSFFLPEMGLERIDVWRNTVTIQYSDRAVVLGLRSPGLDVL